VHQPSQIVEIVRVHQRRGLRLFIILSRHVANDPAHRLEDLSHSI
jgi:hypothetical protein